jgi:hypothetical protein
MEAVPGLGFSTPSEFDKALSTFEKARTQDALTLRLWENDHNSRVNAGKAEEAPAREEWDQQRQDNESRRNVIANLVNDRERATPYETAKRNAVAPSTSLGADIALAWKQRAGRGENDISIDLSSHGARRWLEETPDPMERSRILTDYSSGRAETESRQAERDGYEANLRDAPGDAEAVALGVEGERQ